MNTSLRLMVAGVILASTLTVAHAGDYSFDFTVQQKHDAGATGANDERTTKTQKWFYNVTMRNLSFKDVANMEIKYVIFSKQEAVGDFEPTGTTNFKRQPGTLSIKLLKNNDEVTFSTDGVVLTNVTYNYADYAGEQSKGMLQGLWIRVYVGGQMVSEFTSPTGLANKTTFDPPPKDK
ncbi:MAG TPA: hypothetical protein VG733_00050 [Chthoniobacteraceae bacterium]|nr:hypothetical protein [Chthoniobacteraceae bacterium]